MATIPNNDFLETLQADLPLALEPPKILRCVSPREQSWGNYFLSCGLAMTQKGRIYSSWSGREDGPNGCLMLSCSDNEGITWSPTKLCLKSRKTPHGFLLSNRTGALWCDPKNRLWIFFSQSLNYFDGRAGCWCICCANPDSPIQEWSTPVRLWNGIPLNKPCVLRNGEWALPVSLGIRRFATFSGRMLPSSLFQELDPLRGAHVLVSPDSGRTWERRGFQKCTDPTFYENHLIEKKSGILKMYARDRWGILSAESFDHGWNWSSFQREFISASGRFFLTSLPSGNWLMVRYDMEDVSDDPGLRKRITAYLSLDEGESWEGGLLLDARDKVSYPDGFVNSDGRIFIQHDYLRKAGNLVLSIFREEDILAGKIVSSDARLGSAFPRT